MVSLPDLWLPILLSAVFVFIASSVIHMVLPIHKSDFKKLDNEDDVMGAMRNSSVRPGDYIFPCPGSMKEMASPEMLAKYNAGPVGWMTVIPNGPMAIGKSLAQWFVFSIAISVLAGYIATITIRAGGDYMIVFRVTAVAALLGYGVANASSSIWKGQSWTTSFKFLFDGLVYALVTGGTFGWLWPTLG